MSNVAYFMRYVEVPEQVWKTVICSHCGNTTVEFYIYKVAKGVEDMVGMACWECSHNKFEKCYVDSCTNQAGYMCDERSERSYCKSCVDGGICEPSEP